MVPPRPVSRVPAKDGEQPEDLDTEDREAKHLARLGQPRSQHGGRHEGGVGRQGRREVGPDVARVVEEYDVDG